MVYRAALEEYRRDLVPLDWAMSYGNQGVALCDLARRKRDRAMAQQALAQIIAAESEMRAGGHLPLADYYAGQIPDAKALVAELE